MNRTTTLLVLLLAALLEAGGDAVIRVALHSPAKGTRVALFLASSALLFAYGWTVNASTWDFGQLLGLYVVFFFVIAQILSWLVFRQPPSIPVLAGGALIVSGGLVCAIWQSPAAK